MAYNYHRRHMKQIAEAQVKAGEAGSDATNTSGIEDAAAAAHNLPIPNRIEDWNPNQGVYRKVRRVYFLSKNAPTALHALVC